MNDKRRVLYISYDDIAEPLSASQVLPYLKRLSQNYEIYLLVFNKRRLNRDALHEICAKYNLKKIFCLGYHKWPSLPATVFDIFCGVIRTLLVVKRYKISFIHARSYVACAIALALKKICGIRYIFDVRGLLADERADSGDWGKDSAAYRVVKFYERAMLKEAEMIVTLSHKGVPLLEDISKGSIDKTLVIPTCVDISLFAPDAGDRRENVSIRFIYIGSLGTWYMLPEMLDFFKVASRISKGSRFVILTWSDEAIVKGLVKSKGIDENSVVVKREPHERVPYYLGGSDASLFFIRPTFSKKFSCPTKFAESLAMGVPIIANAGIGDTDDYIKRYSAGSIVGSFNADEYEMAVRNIMNMLSDSGALRSRCRDLALKEFSLESGIKKYENIYESMKS